MATHKLTNSRVACAIGCLALVGTASGAALPSQLNSIDALIAKVVDMNETIHELQDEVEELRSQSGVAVKRFLWSSKLPVQKMMNTSDSRCTEGPDERFPYGSTVGGSHCGYSSNAYLYIKTNLPCYAGDIMYHFTTEGHMFYAGSWLSCNLVGYLYAHRGNTYIGSTCDQATSQSMTITSACGPDSNMLVLRLGGHTQRWHASDISLWMHNANEHYSFLEEARVLDASHADSNPY